MASWAVALEKTKKVQPTTAPAKPSWEAALRNTAPTTAPAAPPVAQAAPPVSPPPKPGIGFFEQLGRTPWAHKIPFFGPSFAMVDIEQIISDAEYLQATPERQRQIAEERTMKPVPGGGPGGAGFGAGLVALAAKARGDKFTEDFYTKHGERARANLEDYITKLDEEQERGFTVPGQIARGVVELPAFMVEFMMTGGFAALGKGVAKNAASRVLGRFAQSKGAQLVVSGAGWIAGAGARTALGMPHRVAKGYAERQMPVYEWSDRGELLAQHSTEAPHISFIKAFGDVLIENMSEVAGEKLVSIPSKALMKLPGAKAVIKRIAGALEKAGYTRAAVKRLQTMGYHGLIGEMAEERLGDAMRAVVGLEGEGNVFERLIQSIPNGEQLLVEAGVLAVPGVAGAVAGGAARMLAPTKAPAKLPPQAPAVRPTAPTVAIPEERPSVKPPEAAKPAVPAEAPPAAAPAEAPPAAKPAVVEVSAAVAELRKLHAPTWLRGELLDKWTKGKISDEDVINDLLKDYIVPTELRGKITVPSKRITVEEHPDGTRTAYVPEVDYTVRAIPGHHREALTEAADSALDELEEAGQAAKDELAAAPPKVAEKQPWEMTKQQAEKLSIKDFDAVDAQVHKKYAELFWKERSRDITEVERKQLGEIRKFTDVFAAVRQGQTKERAAIQQTANKTIEKGEPWRVRVSAFVAFHKTGTIADSAYEDIWKVDRKDAERKTEQPKLLGTIQAAGKAIEIRQTGEQAKYVRIDKEGEIVRDEAGNAEYFTDAEMISKGYPVEDSTVYAWDSKKLVGWAGPSFGAVEIFVHPDYQKQGIGTELLYRHMAQYTNAKKRIGQATTTGTALIRSYHKRLIEDAVAAGKPVPAEVLAEYPDLAKPPAKAEPAVEGLAEREERQMRRLQDLLEDKTKAMTRRQISRLRNLEAKASKAFRAGERAVAKEAYDKAVARSVGGAWRSAESAADYAKAANLTAKQVVQDLRKAGFPDTEIVQLMKKPYGQLDVEVAISELGAAKAKPIEKRTGEAGLRQRLKGKTEPTTEPQQKISFGKAIKTDRGAIVDARKEVSVGDYVVGTHSIPDEDFARYEAGKVVKVLKKAVDIETPDGQRIRLTSKIGKLTAEEGKIVEAKAKPAKPAPTAEKPAEVIKRPAKAPAVVEKKAEPAIVPKKIEGATRAQLAQAHILAKQVGLLTAKGKQTLAYRRLAKEVTGKSSMAKMTEAEAGEFVKVLVERARPAPTVAKVLTEAEHAQIRRAAGSDKTAKLALDYAERRGPIPEDAEIRKAYVKNLGIVARRMRRAGKRAVRRAERGKELNDINPFSSARYALSEAELASGIPLQAQYTELVHIASRASTESKATMQEKLKGIGESIAKLAFGNVQNEAIADWLFAEDVKVKNKLWESMDERSQRVTKVLHDLLQNESANEIREARWRIWDSMDRRTQPKINDLNGRLNAITDKQSEQAKAIEQKIKALQERIESKRPPNAPKAALKEGRTAKAEGRLSEWAAGETWGTRRFYYMAQTEEVDLVDQMMPEGVTDKLEEPVVTAGAAPRVVPGGVETRRGKPARVQGQSVIGSVLHHYERAKVANASMDALEGLWTDVAQAEMSKRDINFLRSFISSALGRRRAASVPTRIMRTAGRYFWRFHFLSPIRSAWFFTRNIFQNLAYAATQFSPVQFGRSAARLLNPKTRAQGIGEWMRNSFSIRISQKRRIYRQFLLQEEGNIRAELGNRAVVLMDALGQAAPISDELNRLGVGPVAYQMAHDAAREYSEGKITYKQLAARLRLDNLHVAQVMELQQHLGEGRYDKFIERVTEMKVENTHFKYETPFRSAAEQTPGSRSWMGLVTFPRGVFELMYQNGVRPVVRGIQSGNGRMVYEGLKTIAYLYAGSSVAKYLLYDLTGKSAYGLWSTILAYGPLGPGPGKIVDFFDDVHKVIWRAEKGDWTIARTADAIVTVGSRQLEMFLPLCDTYINGYESLKDKRGVTLWRLVKKGALSKWERKHGKPFRQSNREFIENVQHMIWGGAEEAKKKPSLKPTRRTLKRRTVR